jgi:hypothetical protein
LTARAALTSAWAAEEQMPALELISSGWPITWSLLNWSCSREERPGASSGACVVPADR